MRSKKCLRSRQKGARFRRKSWILRSKRLRGLSFSPLHPTSLLLVLRSCRAGTSFGSVEHQRKQNALWGYGHGSSSSEYTCSPPTSTSLGSAQQSSFTRQSDVRNILPFRQVIPALRPLIPQRVRSLFDVLPYLIVSRRSQRLL